MSLRSFYLRKKYWVKDFLLGSPMWNSFKEISYISDIQNFTWGG